MNRKTNGKLKTNGKIMSVRVRQALQLGVMAHLGEHGDWTSVFFLLMLFISEEWRLGRP